MPNNASLGVLFRELVRETEKFALSYTHYIT